MRKTLRIKEVRKEVHSGNDYWVFDLYDKDGNKTNHFIPDVAVEWRAAEYGLDPKDVKGILRVLLSEIHIPRMMDRSSASKDPAMKAGISAQAIGAWGEFSHGEEIPVMLNTSEDVDLVREAHLLRVDHVEKEIVNFDVHEDADEDPFDKFEREYSVDLTLVRQASQFLKETRKKTFERARTEQSSAKRMAIGGVQDKASAYRDLFSKRDL